MAEKQETIADIIAEMLGARTEFPFVYLMGEPDTPEIVDVKTKKIIEPRKINIRRVTVKELANRLKAAHKREVGNRAALREALKKCFLYIACAESVGIGTITLNDKVKLDPKKIIKSAKEALAAPPRNCDLLSAEECKRIFAAEMDVYLPPEATDNDRTIATIVANSVIDTLFAPATEKEGSAK